MILLGDAIFCRGGKQLEHGACGVDEG